MVLTCIAVRVIVAEGWALVRLLCFPALTSLGTVNNDELAHEWALLALYDAITDCPYEDPIIFQNGWYTEKLKELGKQFTTMMSAKQWLITYMKKKKKRISIEPINISCKRNERNNTAESLHPATELDADDCRLGLSSFSIGSNHHGSVSSSLGISATWNFFQFIIRWRLSFIFFRSNRRNYVRMDIEVLQLLDLLGQLSERMGARGLPSGPCISRQNLQTEDPSC